MHLHMSGEMYSIYLKVGCLSPIIQGSGSAIPVDDRERRSHLLADSGEPS